MSTRVAGRTVRLTLMAVAMAGGCGRPQGPPPAVVADGAMPDGGFGDVVEAVLPAIVFIQAEAAPPPGLERLLPGAPPLPDGPLPIGAGSGVLFREDGYIGARPPDRRRRHGRAGAAR